MTLPNAFGFPAVNGAGYLRASTVIAENMLRWTPPTDADISGGVLLLTAIPLPAGLTVSNISFVANAGATLPTHQWFGLFTDARDALAFTADDGATAWANTTRKTLALTAPVVTAYEGLYYCGIQVVAVVEPSPCGVGISGGMHAEAPILCGTVAGTGGAPPALPYNTGALTPAFIAAYCSVS